MNVDYCLNSGRSYNLYAVKGLLDAVLQEVV
jgi:hypothetical protein